MRQSPSTYNDTCAIWYLPRSKDIQCTLSNCKHAYIIHTIDRNKEASGSSESLIHCCLFPVNYLNFTWKFYLFISDHLIISMETTPTYTKTTPEINGEPAVKKHCRLLNGGLSPHKNGLTPVRQRLEQQRKKLMETDNAGQQETSPTLQKLRDTPGNRRPRGHTSC
mgnify:CR=1 FL=1